MDDDERKTALSSQTSSARHLINTSKVLWGIINQPKLLKILLPSHVKGYINSVRLCIFTFI